MWSLCLSGLLLPLPGEAQEGLNLPTELYILQNEGVIERYGLGTAGIETVTPDDLFILDFSVSPGGNWLAYRTENGLFMRELYAPDTDPVQFAGAEAGIPPTRGRGQTLVWSPAGDALAYTTENGGQVYFVRDDQTVTIDAPDLMNLVWSPDGVYLAAEAQDEAWWVFRREGAQMQIAAALPSATDAAWLSPIELLYTPVEGGLIALNLDAQNQETLLLDAGSTYFLPQTLPDTRVQVFRGERTAARLLELDVSALPPTVTDISSGAVDLTRVRWSPGGNLLTAFQGGALALVDPASGNGFTLPITSASAYGWGPLYPPRVQALTVPQVAYFLAEDSGGRQQIIRLPDDGSSPAALTAATFGISEFALSPNQQQLTYISNSGLWLTDLSGEADPRELVMLGTNEPITPAWSADGTQIYYRDRQESSSGIWQLDTESSEARLFLEDTSDTAYTNPRPASGINAMVVNRGEALVLVDLQSSSERYIGQYRQSRWLDGSRLLAAGNPMQNDKTTNGLWLVDVNAPDESALLLLPLLSETLTLLDFRRLAGSDTVRVLLRNGTPGAVRVADVALSGGGLQLVGDAGFITQPQIAPQGTALAGTTHPGGALLVVDITAGSRRLLASFAQVEEVRWQD
jgi:Tol biopolymer transport system component